MRNKAGESPSVIFQEQAGQQAQQALAQLTSDARFLPCDVTKEADLQRVADTLSEAWGGVDVVVNNAGVAQVGAIETVSLEDWEWIININLLGVVRGCKVFYPNLQTAETRSFR